MTLDLDKFVSTSRIALESAVVGGPFCTNVAFKLVLVLVLVLLLLLRVLLSLSALLSVFRE